MIRWIGLLLLLALGWILARLVVAALVGAGRTRPATGPRRASAGADPERLVRDRVCNTYVPVTRAVREQVGSDAYFFCSERCRRRFLDGQGAAPQGG